MTEPAPLPQQEHVGPLRTWPTRSACLPNGARADLRLASDNREQPATDERRFQRIAVLCPARIRIGNRQYAGYIHNISAGGAKLRTISAIRRAGLVLLRLPDLPLLKCRLTWSNTYNAGVAFEVPLAPESFANWAGNRLWSRGAGLPNLPTLADLEPLQ